MIAQKVVYQTARRISQQHVIPRLNHLMYKCFHSIQALSRAVPINQGNMVCITIFHLYATDHGVISVNDRTFHSINELTVNLRIYCRSRAQ